MSRLESTIYCDRCGVEITVAPYVRDNQIYCCKDCADGLPCECQDVTEIDDDRRQSSSVEDTSIVL